jgi:hypothetical protein
MVKYKNAYIAYIYPEYWATQDRREQAAYLDSALGLNS